MKKGWIQESIDGEYVDVAPNTLADQVYMDESKTQTVKDAMEAIQEYIDDMKRRENVLINIPVVLRSGDKVNVVLSAWATKCDIELLKDRDNFVVLVDEPTLAVKS